MEICTPLAVKRFLSALKADIHAATVSAGCEFILCLPHACEEGRFFFYQAVEARPAAGRALPRGAERK